jgi:mono/diheme cytochrome c family protein
MNPQKIFEMHCLQCHNGKRDPFVKELHTKFAGKKLELVKALYHCKPAMALRPDERKAIINWLSSK